MKKITIIFLLLVIIFLIVLAVAAVIASFVIVKPTTEAINQKLTEHFSKIVRIPKGILPPNIDFNQTSYLWEMETTEKEVIGVKFTYTPAFLKDQNVIVATLEMPEGSDASIFDKILPAIITDKQSVNSALDVKKANLSANQESGYSKIMLSVKEDTQQTVKITWQYDKVNLTEDLTQEYTKLAAYPSFILKILYSLPHLVIGLLGG